MRPFKAAAAAFGGLGFLLMASVSSCSTRGDDCAANYTCAPEGGGKGVEDPPVVPLGCEASPYDDGTVVRDECGVFVSASSGDDNSQGTVGAPVKTLARALSLAGATVPRVYACAEMFEEAVEVPAGIAVYGGLDCAKGWAATDSKTSIMAPSDQVPMKLLDGDKLTVVAGVKVHAQPATAPGGSSVAMIVGDVEAEITHSRLEASDAAPGVEGGSDTSKLKSAPSGQQGSGACTGLSLEAYPGDPGAQVCVGVTTTGGLGGTGGIPSGPDAQNGGDGAWGDKVGGKGGKAHLKDGLCPKESRGEDGLNGEPGASGVGADIADGEELLGILSFESGYIGVAGTDGFRGNPGAGGGGGGARPAQLCGDGLEVGASGGGGGAGGCGGSPGKGGGGGGSSIALVHLGTKNIALMNVELWTGNGGKGGDGGKGGHGGAGAGGHSLGIASTIDLKIDPSVDIALGEPGAGGDSDDPIGTGAPGKALSIGIFSN